MTENQSQIAEWEEKGTSSSRNNDAFRLVSAEEGEDEEEEAVMVWWWPVLTVPIMLWDELSIDF